MLYSEDSLEYRQKMTVLLQQLVGDLLSVQNDYRYCHWNISGGMFFEFHEHFQEMYENLETKIDDTAERIRMLGEIPVPNWTFSRTYDKELVQVNKVIQQLREYTGSIVKLINIAIKVASENEDETTLDFLVEMRRDFEKTDYFYSNILILKG